MTMKTVFFYTSFWYYYLKVLRSGFLCLFYFYLSKIYLRVNKSPSLCILAGCLFRIILPDDDDGGPNKKNPVLVIVSIFTICMGTAFIFDTVLCAITGRYSYCDKLSDWVNDFDRAAADRARFIEDIQRDMRNNPGKGWGPFPVEHIKSRDPDIAAKFGLPPRDDSPLKKEMFEDIFSFTESIVRDVVRSHVRAGVGPLPISRQPLAPKVPAGPAPFEVAADAAPSPKNRFILDNPHYDENAFIGDIVFGRSADGDIFHFKNTLIDNDVPYDEKGLNSDLYVKTPAVGDTISGEIITSRSPYEDYERVLNDAENIVPDIAEIFDVGVFRWCLWLMLLIGFALAILGLIGFVFLIAGAIDFFVFCLLSIILPAFIGINCFDDISEDGARLSSCDARSHTLDPTGRLREEMRREYITERYFS